MAVDGHLNFDTKVNTSGFNKGTKNITSSLGGLKTMLGKVAIAAAAAFSVKAIIDFGKQSVALASDLQEVQNVVDTAFGEMSYKMEEFAENSITQFGISKLSAKQTGSTFMAMASGMGIAKDSASDMAIAMTGLSADMASFYNVKQDVASTALKSVFTGETETLKQFGIVMTEANLQAFAMSQGISKSVSEMSQAEKVQLRYNYVMQQTSLAQGDFAKTSGGWANQTRIMSEQFKELGGTIGTLLMNVLLPAVKTINTALSQLISWAGQAVKAISEVFGIEMQTSTAAGIYNEDTSAVAENYSDIAENAEKTQKANEKSLAGFDKITKLSEPTDDSSSSASVTPLPTAISLPTVTQEIDVDTSKAGEKLSKLFKTIKTSFEKVFEPLKKAWKKHGEAVIKSVKKSINGISALIEEIGESFATVWTNGTGQKTIENIFLIFTNINNLIGTISQRFATAWGDGTGTDIIQSLFDIFNNILTTINNIYDKTVAWAQTVDFTPLLESIDILLLALEPFTNTVGEGLEWFWTNVLLPIGSWAVEDVAPAFIELLSEVISTLDTTVNSAKPIFLWLWDEFLQPIAQWVSETVVDAIKKLTEKLKDFSDWATDNQDIMDIVFSLILGFLSAIVFYYVKKKIVALITKIGTAFLQFGIYMSTVGGQVALAATAIAVLAAGIIYLAMNWDKLSTAEKYITILGGLAAAATACAIAVALFHTAWSVGVAAV